MIGKIIHVVRAERGLSQSEFGKMLGVTKQAISAWEKGQRTPSYSTLLGWVTRYQGWRRQLAFDILAEKNKKEGVT